MSDTPEVTPEVTPSLPENVPIPPALAEVDRDKLALFMQRVQETTGASVPGSPPINEDIDSAPRAPEAPPQVLTGRDVDWSEYDLNFNVAHLYPRAAFRETPEGPKWVVMLDEYYTADKELRAYGKQVAVPGSPDGDKEPQNGGEWITQMVNGREGWKLVGILPGSIGRMGVMLQRQVPYILPDPTPLKKETEVEAPKDPELQAVEDAALAWAEGEGLTPPAVEDRVDESAGPLEAQALAINPPTERLPQPFGEHKLTREPDMSVAAGEAAEQAAAGPDFEKQVDEQGNVSDPKSE